MEYHAPVALPTGTETRHVLNRTLDMGRCSSVGIATCYGLDGPGDRIPAGGGGGPICGGGGGGGEIFCSSPDRSWGPPNLTYNGYRIHFPGVKRPLSSSAEDKERIELYLYSCLLRKLRKCVANIKLCMFK